MKTGTAIKEKFTLDYENYFEGYTFGQTWNGFEVPYFTEDVVREIAKMFTNITFKYNELNGAFEINDSDNEEIEPEVCERHATLTEDGIKPLYCVGGFAWVWSKLEQE